MVGLGFWRGAGTTAIRITATAITLMATVARTAMVTVVAATDTATTILTVVTSMVMATGMDTTPGINLSTMTVADPESPSCNGGCHGLAITMDPSTASSGRKRGAQSGRTSKTTITLVNRRHSVTQHRQAAIIFSVDWPAVS